MRDLPVMGHRLEVNIITVLINAVKTLLMLRIILYCKHIFNVYFSLKCAEL